MDDDKEINQYYIDLLKKSLTASLYEESSWEEVKKKDYPFLKNPFKFCKNIKLNNLVKNLEKKSKIIINKSEYNSEKRENGMDWPLFGFTMAGHKRLENVEKCVNHVLSNQIPGDFIETGVWRGGASIFMRAMLKVHGDKKRKVWVADSFQGLPKPKNEEDGWDLSDEKYLKVNLDQVKKNFHKFNLLDDQVVFLEGWFSETLPKAPIKEIAILRLDGDLYTSTMDALENLYKKVSKGGFVIVDDYYSWPSCKQAVTDFFDKNNMSPDVVRIDWTGAYWMVD